MTIFVYTLYMDQVDWREPGQRYLCGCDVKVTGLSGKEVQGTTVIMVPIPASKEGKFFTPPLRKTLILPRSYGMKSITGLKRTAKVPILKTQSKFLMINGR